MGRTVYGVDLEESPFGGLIEKLLTEEELEKLADGGAVAGRPGDRDTAPDGGGDAADDWNVSDETYGSPDDGSDPVESDAPSSPPPSTAPDETDSTDDDGPDSTGYGEFGDAGFDDTGAEDDGGGVGGFLSTHKWLLLKVAVAFAALAAVLVVVWRYKDKLAGVVPGRGGGEDEFDADSDASADRDVSPARRRAKVDEDEDGAGATDEFDEEESVGGRDDSRQGPAARRPDESEGVTTPGQDVDLGALLGLGFLAFLAALVRKFDEERNRPHDPLVDGPLDEDDDE
ncbi:hypothetical protein BRC78_08655 [Halobacteriales archaeon QH_8_68_33]|nr:MAG: hypothetical protein BRC78_08655 [Halobacteriales archaeon QH_8_68_33]